LCHAALAVVEQLALLAMADGAGQVVVAFLQVADVLDVVKNSGIRAE
jgi:hypothetical protein